VLEQYKKKKMKLACQVKTASQDSRPTANLPSKRYSAQGRGGIGLTQKYLEKRFGERNMDIKLQVQLEEDRDGSTR